MIIKGSNNLELFDVYNNLINVGDYVVYSPTSRWSQPRIVQIQYINSTLCVVVNGIGYSGYYLYKRCVLLKDYRE